MVNCFVFAVENIKTWRFTC